MSHPTISKMEVIEKQDRSEESFPEMLISTKPGDVLQFSLKHYRSITSLISEKLKFRYPEITFKTTKKNALGVNDGLTFFVKHLTGEEDKFWN